MGLISLDEYLEMQKENLNRYYSIPGRKFHSLDDSSFNAWIKLYRPDENSNNSSMSYYLKGGIVFFALNILFSEKQKSINDFLKLLWSDYQNHPERGLKSADVFKMVEAVGGVEIREKFEFMTSTTEDIDFETLFLKAGMKFEWDKSETPWLGIDAEFSSDRVLIKSVTLDGPAYKAGLNAGDEIIAINGMRILKDRYNELFKFIRPHQTYSVVVSRLGILQDLSINCGVTPMKLKAITAIDKDLIEKVLKP